MSDTSPIMTLEEFRASKREVDDIEAVLPNLGWDCGGLIYAGDLVIEWGTNAAWCLTIGNDSQESHDLDALEEELYHWAVCEGVIEEPVSDESRSTGKSTGFDPENDADDFYASDEHRSGVRS